WSRTCCRRCRHSAPEERSTQDAYRQSRHLAGRDTVSVLYLLVALLLCCICAVSAVTWPFRVRVRLQYRAQRFIYFGKSVRIALLHEYGGNARLDDITAI